METNEKLIRLMEENNQLLKSINRSKDQFQIIVSDNKTDFTKVFNPPLVLDQNKSYEIALVDLETYYSFSNITFENNIIEYHKEGESRFKKIQIPPGSYELRGLNNEIQRQLTSRGDKEAIVLEPNSNTFKSIMKVKEGYKVKLTGKRSIKHTLGFTESYYNAGTHTSENIVNILAINSIFVHLNVINGSFVNGTQSPVIYTFFPKVSPGYKIIQRPVNPIYLPISLQYIRDFNVKLTDQNNNLLDLRGEEVTIRFHIRER